MELTLRVSDLRQYTYCPRIVYYYYCLPAVRPTTYNMQAGKEAHIEEADRERRRSLRTYHLSEGERYFDFWLESEGLGLQGKVDMAIRCTQEAIPVEYKNSPGRSGQHVLLQLTAYGLLLEELWGLPVRRGFVYYIPARRAREIEITSVLKTEVRDKIAAITTMVLAESMPTPPPTRGRCEICEFRRFCNDVV